MSTTQATLDGGETDIDRQRPSTFMYVPETDMWILRSERFQTGHEVVDPDDYFDSDGDDSPYDEFDPDEQVGSYYSVEISQSVDYRFTVPAWSDARAKEIAKEWMLDAVPSDRYTVHTSVDEGSEIERQELPDDFDPYSGERIVDAIERMEEDDT